MSVITEKIKRELLIRCERSKQKDGYDFWNEHIKYVRKKLERDYNKLSQKTRELLKDRYKNIISVLFVN